MDILTFVKRLARVEPDAGHAKEVARRLSLARSSLSPELANQLTAFDLQKLGLAARRDIDGFIATASTTRAGSDVFDKFYRHFLADPLHPAIARDYIFESVLHFGMSQRDFPEATLGVKKPVYLHVGSDVSPFIATIARAANIDGVFFTSAGLRERGISRLPSS